VRSFATGLNAIYSVAIFPDCRRLATGGGGVVCNGRWVHTGGVEVWTLDGKKRIAKFGEELRFIMSIAFSPDGALLLTSNHKSANEQSTADKRRIRLWRTSNFKEVKTFGEHEDGIASACFSPDGRFVAFGSNQTSSGVILRTVPPRGSGLQRLLLRLRIEKVEEVRIHDISSLTPSIRIWNIATQREEPELQLPKGRIEAVAFSPDGRMLASCGRSIVIWDFEARRVIKELGQGSPAYTICLAFSPDSGILATGGGYRFSAGSPFEDCGVKLWDSETGRLFAFLPHKRPVHSLRFSPDGQRIVAGGEAGELLMWNVPPYFSDRPNGWDNAGIT
jgi:WD40 repeat protein